MELHEWIAIGREHGFCSRIACDTHEGVPQSEAEEKEWDEGGDPCILVVRIYTEDTPMSLVERDD